MSYSYWPCRDTELCAQGIEFEVHNDTPTTSNLNECVALCYSEAQAKLIVAALNKGTV